MAEQNDETNRRQTAERGWLALGGKGRAGSLFWTSPQIRSFPSPRRRDRGDLSRLDQDRRSPGSETPK